MAAHNNKDSLATTGSVPGSTNTTFVQADPSTFRAIVQKLTGPTGDPSIEKLPVTFPARQTMKSLVPDMGPRRRPAFKLHERRQNMRKLEINLGGGSCGSVVASARQMNFKGGDLVLVSPVSPLDFFSGGGSPRTPRLPFEEERAIAEKGFYLHPSPLNTPRSTEPELLPLFPLHSPRDPNSS